MNKQENLFKSHDPIISNKSDYFIIHIFHKYIP